MRNVIPKAMTKKSMRAPLVLAAVAVASLVACSSPDTSPENAAVYPSFSPGATPELVTPSVVIDDADGTEAYVRQFREQFPQLVEDKTDNQIISDAEASCSDMAGSAQITTDSMEQRYGLGDSAADQFTLHNVALLAMFTVCPDR